MQTAKYSRQREAILTTLRSTKSHPDADWIYEQTRKEIPNISLGTVYRNLSKLSDDGAIIKIEVGDGREHYDGDLTPHSHFVCNTCKKIVDIEKDFSHILNEEIKSADIKINGYKLIFNGLCNECNV